MALDITRDGFGQVEPNHLSAQRTGQIFASLPLDETVEILQNGEFMFYDEVAGKVTGQSSNITEPYLVYNEEKIYSDFGHRKDFAMIRKGNNYSTENNILPDRYVGDPTPVTPQNGGYRMVGFAPRLFKINIGDIFTTNMVKLDSYSVGDDVSPVYNATTKTLQLEKGTSGAIKFKVVKEFTMPDGQPAVKLTRVA